jgi:hypothetical protein
VWGRPGQQHARGGADRGQQQLLRGRGGVQVFSALKGCTGRARSSGRQAAAARQQRVSVPWLLQTAQQQQVGTWVGLQPSRRQEHRDSEQEHRDSVAGHEETRRWSMFGTGRQLGQPVAGSHG